MESYIISLRAGIKKNLVSLMRPEFDEEARLLILAAEEFRRSFEGLLDPSIGLYIDHGSYVKRYTST